MIIKGYLQTSVIEWPGKISCVIFTSGCNFRCGFCYNAELADPSHTLRMTGLKEISEKSIFEDLEKRKKWVDAVVVTGGEPTLQPDLEKFLKTIKDMGFLTMIETNGSNPEIIARLLSDKIVDRVAMDIKGPFELYSQITNSSIPISNIQQSINLILNSGIEYEFRTTVVPGIHDTRVLLEMKKQLLEMDNGKWIMDKNFWTLQNFQPHNCLDPEFNKLKPFTEEEMEEFKKIVFPQDEVLRS